ncbi:MAG: hypothetical protein JWM91_375 [Rhodospirillales bacterium]|nr:hypothetical protein [Rhodospirillales bacterium]
MTFDQDLRALMMALKAASRPLTGSQTNKQRKANWDEPQVSQSSCAVPVSLEL